MKTEDQRIAIARYCHPEMEQYKLDYWYTQEDDNTHDWVWIVPDDPESTCVTSHILPKYPDSLDAMHEAEKVLTPQQQFTYCCALERKVNDVLKDSKSAWCYALASAPQRAEAFLRTLGLWKEAA
jgi:hypothetical protein